MRFVVAKASSIVRSVPRRLIVATIIGVLFACAPGPVSAQSTTISVPLCDEAPATIAVSTPQNNSVFNQPTVALTGTVYRLTQIQVYLNDAYVSTIPLDSGATSFTTEVYVYQGSNIIKLVGIDPCSSTSPEVEWKVIYAPGAEPTIQPTSPGTLPRPVQAVVDSSAYLQEQVDVASQTEPAQSLSGVLYDALVALDIAPKNAPQEEMNRMIWRMLLVVTGTSLLLLAGPIVSLYHLVRYKILAWNIHALPELLHHHATLALRLLGVVLIAIPFLFIG